MNQTSSKDKYKKQNSLSESINLDKEQLWLIHVAAEIIAAHPKKAPKAKILYKILLTATTEENNVSI